MIELKEFEGMDRASDKFARALIHLFPEEVAKRIELNGGIIEDHYYFWREALAGCKIIEIKFACDFFMKESTRSTEYPMPSDVYAAIEKCRPMIDECLKNLMKAEQESEP